MTLLTTMLDFTDTGEIGLLVSEEGVAQREASIGKGGLLKGSELAQVFASLRANDLIWPYVVKGYLKGQAPPAFDLLYWNSDDTNLPGPMFCWYLRNTYLENKLREPGAHGPAAASRSTSASIDVPAFVYASKEDHIVPWKTAYASTQTARRRPHLRAGSERPHRRRDQPAGEDEAELLGRTGMAPTSHADADALVRERGERSGQLVADLERMARTVRRRPGRRTGSPPATRISRRSSPLREVTSRRRPPEVLSGSAGSRRSTA